MQTHLGFHALLFTAFVNAGLPTISFATACADYQAQVTQAVKKRDFESLEKLLPQLNSREVACPPSYLTEVERSMAQIAAAEADALVEQGKLTQAEAWLKRAPTEIWKTQVIHGDIYAQREWWAEAVRFFNQALDLIDDPNLTPEKQKPSNAEIKKIHELVSVAQSLAEESEITTLRASTRGVPRRRLIPILFNHGETKLNNKGRSLANQLARHIKRRKANKVILSGHSEPDCYHTSYCQKISERRANAVKNYLQRVGVKSDIIKAKGMGKSKPLFVFNRWKLSKARIEALSRRVEFDIK